MPAIHPMSGAFGLSLDGGMGYKMVVCIWVLILVTSFVIQNTITLAIQLTTVDESVSALGIFIGVSCFLLLVTVLVVRYATKRATEKRKQQVKKPISLRNREEEEELEEI